MTYTVTGVLGRGAMSVVELAVDGAGREVARKRITLTGSWRQIEVARLRLRREAQLLAALRHPGIVPLLAVEDDGEELVLVMPRMVASLADRVETSGPLEPGDVAAMGRHLLAALVVAHRQGIVHRDIKPANILFDSDGRPALADFGIAAARDLTAGLTQTGSVLGTPAFMAPELARGAPATPASDVFSLAATLGYALTGGGPYGQGQPAALLVRAATGPVPPLPASIPADLRVALGAMLSTDPSRRPSAAAALGGATDTRVDLAPVPAALRRPRRRRKGLSAPGAGYPAGGVTAGWARSADNRSGRLSRRSSGRRQPGPRQAEPAGAGDTRRRRSRAALAGGLGLALVGAAAVVGAVVLDGSGGSPAGRAAAGGGTPVRHHLPAATCTPLRYRPCGATAAAHTNGRSCLPGYYDLDGRAANGCEAASHRDQGATLVAGRLLRANLVPPGKTNTYRTYVRDSGFDFCQSTFRVTIKAPARVSDEVQIVQGTHVLASAVSTDGVPATASTSDPHCFHDDTGWVTLRVSDLAGASGADFTLSRSGHW